MIQRKTQFNLIKYILLKHNFFVTWNKKSEYCSRDNPIHFKEFKPSKSVIHKKTHNNLLNSHETRGICTEFLLGNSSWKF